MISVASASTGLPRLDDVGQGGANTLSHRSTRGLRNVKSLSTAYTAVLAHGYHLVIAHLERREHLAAALEWKPSRFQGTLAASSEAPPQSTHESIVERMNK